MAIDIKNIIAETLLRLCETTHLDSITIKQILNESHVSKQTFYNHFIDKNDLIQYIYTHKIIVGFQDGETDFDFYTQLLKSFYNMKKYHLFMKQACLRNDQNCLKDYMFKHCKEFDLKWHQTLYGKEEIPEALRFATEYHANASSSMVLSWILSDMSSSCEEMADIITQLRSVGMEKLFENGKTQGNPYQRH